MKNLKDYKTIKTPLLKEWSEKDFKINNMHGIGCIKLNLGDNVKFVGGAKPQAYSSLRWLDNEQIEQLFGLPYVSAGSDFAGLWNTNTQCVTKYLKTPLYFRCVAINENRKAVLVFHDKNENYYYFEEYEFLSFSNEQFEIQRAEQVAEFEKECKTAMQIVVEILANYVGKAYGEKTREKIYSEINEKTSRFNFHGCWLSTTGETLSVSKYVNGGRIENEIYLRFLNNENKVQAVEILGNSQPKEFNGVQTWKKAQELKEKIKKQSATLLELVEDFNELTRLLHKDCKDTNIFNYQLSSIAKYGISGV